MRDGYKLEPTDNVNLDNLVSPFGERIAVIERHVCGIEIRPSLEGIGQIQDIPIENIELDKDGSILEMSAYPIIETACSPYVEAHYKIRTKHRERFRNWIAKWNPVWGWLFGLIATVFAIWGWID